MSWSSFISAPSGQRYIVAHTDLDGIARTAAVLTIPSWANARVLIRYSRTKSSTIPNTLPAFLEEMEMVIPAGAEVLFIDIPVDIRNPENYIKALEKFAASRKVVWTDHHETDAPFLLRLNSIPNLTAMWFGPSAYEYTLALVQWLGGNPNDLKVQLFAKLCAIGDRDPTIVRLFSKELPELLEIADGLDVLIREQSAGGEAEYENFARELAFNTQALLQNAVRRAGEIPVPSHYTTIGRSVLVEEELPSGWGPKALEKVAFRTKSLYAIGVSRSPRDNLYMVRAITYWISLATTTATEIGNTEAFRRLVAEIGQRPFGPPAAPVVPGFTTFGNALEFAKRLAEELSREFYVPKSTHLINDRYVAEALSQDFSAILSKLAEILETQKEMYQEYLRLKKKQVELLEGATEEDRKRYD